MLRCDSPASRARRSGAFPALLVLLITWLAALPALAQPTISSFAPSSGAAGSTIVITGSGFTGVTSVRFGELAAQFTVNSSSQLTAVVPRAASTQLLNVTTSAGYVFSASDFTVTRGSSVTYAPVTSSFAGVSGGVNAAPAVADLDGDGRLDLLVGKADGTISRYEQATVNGTAFTSLGLLSTGAATIDVGTQATVAIVDLEGNGLYNLLLGRGDGTVDEYEQTAAGASTFALVQNNFSGISTPSNTATSMTDLDGDGNLELLVGKGDGITSHSEQFDPNTNNFYRIDTNFNGLQLSGNAAPFCVDLDGNGRIDILMGTSTGAIYRYEQAAAGSFTVSQVSSNFNSISVGANPKPCVTDIDGDGLLDLLVGKADGTISRYEQAGTVPAPTITGFTPTNGPVGTSVTVTGTNLAGVSAVTVNGTPGTITGLPTATSFTFTVGTGSTTGVIGVTTAGGTANSSGTFTVGSNTAPTALSLSASTINENVAAGSTVGTFSTTDAQGGPFTYALVTGSGSTNNASFSISGSSLTINAVPNYEAQPSYAIRVRTTDAGGLWFEQTFTITVNDLAELPTVTSFTPTGGAVGTSVTITGTNYSTAGAVTVRFAGTVATAVTVNSNSELTAIVPTGAGTGTISVQNADGTGSSSASFTVWVPATVTTATPGTVTASSAVLGGNVTSNNTVTERGVVYLAGSGTPTTSNTKAATGTGTGPFSATVSGLAGNTLYSVRAYAINGAGTSYGSTQTFTTLNNPPTAVDNTYTVGEDSGPTPFSVLGNDTDPDAGTTLTITAVTQPANGSVTFNSTNVTFTPAAGFSGNTSFTYTIADGNGGSDTGTVTVTVTAVNDAPVVTVPGPQTTNQNTPFAFSSGAGNAITIGDVDAGSGQLEIYLQATQGAIYLSTTAGLTFSSGDGTADASMTFRGTLAAINTALNNMSFSPNTGYFGAAALQVQANDLGNTGSGGAKTDTETVSINVLQPVNLAPVVTVPATQSTAFNTALTLSSGNGNAVSVADADAGSAQLSVYLTVGFGTATLSTTAGLTFTGGSNGSGSFGFKGTLPALNAALNGLVFQPNNNYSGAASLQVQVDDQGNTGSGGAKTDSETLTINVAANQAPVLTASGGSTTFITGGAAVAVDAGLTAADANNATLASGTVSISSGHVSSQDVLAFSNTNSAAYGNITASYVSGTGVLTLTSSGATATVAQWQAALRAVTYDNTSATPTGTSRTVSFRVNDGVTSSASVTKTIALPPPPALTGLSSSAELPGQAVTLTGTGFTSGSTVTFGGVAAGSVTYNSATSLTATVPAGAAAGTSPVVVTTATGSSTSSPSFEVLQVYRNTTATASACLSTTPLTVNGTGGTGSWLYLRLPAGQGQAVVAAIENTVNLGSVTVGVLAQGTATTQPVRDDGKGRRYLDRNFYLTATNQTFTGQSVRVRFFGLNSELARLTAADANATAANLKVSQYDGPNEDCSLANNGVPTSRRLLPAPATVVSGADWFTAEATVADHFSEFYLTGASTPLPVQLISFTAQPAGPAAVQLAWTTAQEVNSAYFEVERSLDGRAFTAIGRTEAAGRSTAARAYQLLDPAAPTDAPLLYYRIRAVDQDATYAYSAVQTVRRAAPAAGLHLYPNPTHAAATLTGAAPGATVRVFDALGRVLLTTRADATGTTRLALPAGSPAGVYLVRCGGQAMRLLLE